MENKPALLAQIRNQSIDMPMGGFVKDYIDQFGTDIDLCNAVHRFLDSGSEMNRSAALRALMCDPSTAHGLEADAILLHFLGKRHDSIVQFEAVDYLYKMAEFGSAIARRMLMLLLLDRAWAITYGRSNSNDLLH